jgi:Tfp pilus assembly major pilin PilA
MRITNNTEAIAFMEKSFRDYLYKAAMAKAAMAESNGNLRLEVKVANSIH